MCYDHHIWSEEPLMQAKNDNDIHGCQRSTEIKHSKLCSMAALMFRKIADASSGG